MFHFSRSTVTNGNSKILKTLTLNRYPVQAGDVIWMAPFVPQWYVTLSLSLENILIYASPNIMSQEKEQ